MIIPATLIHIAVKEYLNMYNRTMDEAGRDTIIQDQLIGKQMLMNYCFGHRESSVLLCPSTAAVAMNHCSTRMKWDGECGEKGANAGYRWPKDWSPETDEWRQLPFEELKTVSVDCFVTVRFSSY